MSFYRFFKKLQSDSNGFTLVEIIVTLAIFSIVLVVASNYLLFGNRMFTETEVKNTEKSIGDNAFKYMKRKIVYATKLEIINKDLNPQPTPKYNQKMYIGTGDDNGDLMLAKKEDTDKNYQETNLFGQDYYGLYILSYNVKVLDDTRLSLTITVKHSGENDILYSASEVIKNINLANSSSKIIQTGSNNQIAEDGFVDPIISFDTETKLSTVYSPIELREQMLYTYDMFKKNKLDEFPENYRKIYPTNNSKGNDNVRGYVGQYYYHGEPYIINPTLEQITQSFPDFEGFPKEVIEKTDRKIEEYSKKMGISYRTLEDFLSIKGLKMQAFICLGGVGPNDGSCYVYVSEKSGWQNVSLVHNFETDTWYYGFRAKGSQLGIANKPWRTVTTGEKEHEGVWNFIEEHEISTMVEVPNGEAWIRIEE